MSNTTINLHNIVSIEASRKKVPSCHILELNITDRDGVEVTFVIFTNDKAPKITGLEFDVVSP